jgi:hypothetical protein
MQYHFVFVLNISETRGNGNLTLQNKSVSAKRTAEKRLHFKVLFSHVFMKKLGQPVQAMILKEHDG